MLDAADPAVKRLAGELISGAQTAAAKWRRIFDAVRNRVNFTPHPSSNQMIRPALETWRSQVGNCVDMTILIAALARAAGLDARATVVSMDGANYIHMLVEGDGVIADPVECDRLFAAGSAMNALPAALRAVMAVKTAYPPAAIIDPLIAAARAPEPIIATYAGPAAIPPAERSQRQQAAAPPVYSPPPAHAPPAAPVFDPGIRPEFQRPPDHGGSPAAVPRKCACPPRWPWMAAGFAMGWIFRKAQG